jgi:hypothetical protein
MTGNATVIARAGATAGLQSSPVTLGRPIAVTPNAPLPTVPDGGIIPVSYQTPAAHALWPSGRNPQPEPPPPSPPEGTWFVSLEKPPSSAAEQGSFAAENSLVQPVRYTNPGVINDPSVDWTGRCGPGVGPCPADGIGAPGNRFYGSAEYLLWTFKDARVPALVTTSSPASAGILGSPDTVILFGGSKLDSGDFSGGRFTGGFWLDPCQTKAIEFSGFFLGDRSVNFQANSTQFPVLARPFFNFNFGTEFSEVTASPGLSTGQIDIRSSTNLWGTEANLRCKACCGCNYRVGYLVGFRYLELAESLNIRETIDVLPGVPMFGGDHITVLDTFSTHNRFYGGQIGLDAEVRRGPWFADFRGKLALGDTRQVVQIGGGQTITTPAGVTSNFLGGLLALPTNIGHFHRDEFGVVPELGINVGYQFNDHWRAFVGYSFLYWSSVVRPGDQIDRVLDVTRIPNFSLSATPLPAPQARPAVLFRDTEFWAQGLNVGLEFRY